MGNYFTFLGAVMYKSINIFYSFFALDKTRTTTYFSVFVLFLGLWQASDGLIKMSRNAEVAGEWNRIAWILVLFLIPFGIQFILHFAGWFKRKFYKLVSVLLYLPPFIFFLFIEARLDKHTIVNPIGYIG